MKRSAWMVAALVMSAGMAFGQATTEKAVKPAEPVLKGPEVKDNSLPGTKGQFGPDGAKGKEVRGMQGPNPMLFRQAVMSLKNKETPEDLRLTPTQEDSINLISDDAQRTNTEYRTKHMDEVRELMKDLPPQERMKAEMLLRARGAGGPGGPQGRAGRPAGPDGAPGDGPQGRQGRPQRGPGPDGVKPEGFRPEGPANDEMMPPPPKDGEKAGPDGGVKAEKPDALTPEQIKEREAKAEKAKARLKEIMESAPKPQDAQSRVYAILSDGQKALVDKRLAEMTAKQQQQQANRRGGQGKPGEAGAKRPGGRRGAQGEAGPDGQQAPANAERDARRAEMREKMQNMTPEERKAFIDEMRAKREARRGQGKPGEAKPAPGTDNVTPPAP